MAISDECPDRVRSVLDSLQISLDVIKARSLVLQPEAEELVVVELGNDGREHLLVAAAAKAWRELSSAARSDGVTVKIVSAFRSVDRQAEIVRGKLARGLSLDTILCVSAPPGYSEHHSGRAVDVTTDGAPPLELVFEDTEAFRWLSMNAVHFGFTLSFPKQNPYGYAYEPWHWYFATPSGHTTHRAQLVSQIAERVVVLANPGVLCVAVDGVDGAGKSTFADELGQALAALGRPVIRASVDGFHNPRAVRYRQGRTSPQGFFEDSYDYAKLREFLLDPLTPAGSRRFRRAAFDHRNDAPVAAPEEEASMESILIFDGIFLHRPELRRYWHFSVVLDVPFHISIPRGAQRGEGSPDPRAESNRRYVEGQTIYLRTCNPREHATLVVNNEKLDDPYIVTELLPELER